MQEETNCKRTRRNEEGKRRGEVKEKFLFIVLIFLFFSSLFFFYFSFLLLRFFRLLHLRLLFLLLPLFLIRLRLFERSSAFAHECFSKNSPCRVAEILRLIPIQLYRIRKPRVRQSMVQRIRGGSSSRHESQSSIASPFRSLNDRFPSQNLAFPKLDSFPLV